MLRFVSRFSCLIFSLVFSLILLVPTSSFACPDKTAWGETYEASGRNLTRTKRFSVQAGGEFFINDCRNLRRLFGSDRGNGAITVAPDFTFNLSGMNRYRLQIAVVSRCDSVLVINTASETWYYDDDDNGNLDAKIVLTNPANGFLDVWVGTHDGSVCDAELRLTAF